MPNPLLNLRAGRPVGLGRNHDYTAIYEEDQPGQESSENARVWRVYLDEADAYDTDMISSFQTILDSLLVFASLFSAVVTTFVSQTSQVLQPDNTQITVALLVETNRLLRAAGNITKIESVSPSALGPNSPTHSSTDLWINGLFFTSLTLSVSTALLSVLVKQWIQAYTQIVPGSAKTQTRIRQFRFDGLQKWKLGSIIEGLPLILHSSVAIFLVGLSLYVSQLSPPICAILSSITAMTFIFYLVTSMIPAFYIDCPFRLTSIFFVARWVFIVAEVIPRTFFHYLMRIFPSLRRKRIIPFRYKFQRPASFDTLRNVEYREAMPHRQPWAALTWLFDHSTNNSTKDIVLEGISGILDQYRDDSQWAPNASQSSLLIHALVYCTVRQNQLEAGSNSDTFIQSKWGTLINKVLFAQPRFEAIKLANWAQQVSFEAQIWKRNVAAWRAQDFRLDRRYFINCGNRHDIRCAMDDASTRAMCLSVDGSGKTLLHDAVRYGKLKSVIALVDSIPELINVRTRPPNSMTALDLAIHLKGLHDFGIIEYLLEHGGVARPFTLHVVALYGHAEAIIAFLDRGWDRAVKNKLGATPIDLARIRLAKYNYRKLPRHEQTIEDYRKTVDYLENYQTVPLPHPSLLTTPPTISEHEIPTNAIPLTRTT
ncbi:hypothetical protein H0H93_008219, partial [Arthromyces matolae]